MPTNKALGSGQQSGPPQLEVARASHTYWACAILLTARLLAATYSPIQDCDEVFNFWEPTHYLNHGFGLQTWELSPEYAIRSWLYTSMHAVPIYLASWAPFLKRPSAEFFAMRFLFAIVCAGCELRLFVQISRCISTNLGWCFVIATASSAGMFHASVSYLPSTFAMYTVILATAAFLDRTGKKNFAQGMTWLALGTIVGWPFVGVMAVPFVMGELFSSYREADLGGLLGRLTDAACRSIAILGLEIVVDSLFYRKLVCVPFNIVWYNVFSDGKGPNIYGTEPWHFYLRNLLINFNFWIVLAVLATPLLLIQRAFSSRAESRLSLQRCLVFLSPFYLWLVIFTVQPHKEERFMYPAYPLLASNAAYALHIINVNLGAANSLRSIAPARFRLLLIISMVSGCIALGVWRIVGLTTAYSAPMALYNDLQYKSSMAHSSTPINVCVGKEWYRFASSYHLPRHARFRFIKSEFAGLLPGAFNESQSAALGPFPGTHLLPKGMNDQNLEDPSKYTSIEACDYLVDSGFESSTSSNLEPNYMADSTTWETETCLPFLDASKTNLLGRVFWIPEYDSIPSRYRRTWGTYCLLKRRSGVR